MARQTFITGSLLAISIGIGVGWAAPPRPVAVSPGDPGEFSRVAQSCPTFSWGGVEGALAYELVVFAVDRAVLEERQLEEPRAPRLQVTLPGTAFSFTPSMDRCLEHGGRYAWFVRALGTGVEEWSQAKVFQVSSRPSIAEVEEALEVLRRYRGEERDEELDTLRPDEGMAEVDTVTASVAHPAGGDRRQGPNGKVADSDDAAERNAERSEALRSRLGRVGSLDLGSVAARAPAPTLGTASLTLDQQIHLGAATSVFKEGELFLWGDNSNTALGRVALQSNVTGSRNTAIGDRALSSNTTGTDSTAVGYRALETSQVHPTFGSFNTAVGSRALYANTTGNRNTASGVDALRSNTTGYVNTASGAGALPSNTTGSFNTASGAGALFSNTIGSSNTASGRAALFSNTTGSRNTANGDQALASNTTGTDSTALGYRALDASTGHPTYGSHNTAVGSGALRFNTTGFFNTAAGAHALRYNSTGDRNTASGFNALRSNTTGFYNTAAGAHALRSNSTGYRNTASGGEALYRNTTGRGNVGIGFRAGFNNTTGNDNIFISNRGVGGEGHTIRIGSTGSGIEQQNRTFIAGIRGITTGIANAVSVVIDSAGQLGTISSSRRYKEDIRDMAEVSSDALKLRPVTFRYKREIASGDRPLQFGLIAEEVAELYPELVAWGEDGQPETVLYHFLSSMLLNEVQKQHARIEAQERELGELRTRLVSLEARETEIPAQIDLLAKKRVDDCGVHAGASRSVDGPMIGRR